MKSLLIAGAFLGFSAVGFAQYEISVVGNDGETFNLFTAANVNSTGEYSDSTNLYWSDQDIGDPVLFTSVTGSNLTGTFDGATEGLSQSIEIDQSGNIQITIEQYGGPDGLTTVSNGQGWGGVYLSFNVASTGGLTFAGTNSNAGESLGSLPGVLDVTSSDYSFDLGPTGSPSTGFYVASATVTAVPEPAAIGEWCAAAAMAVVILGRRGRPAVQSIEGMTSGDC